jgi:hypothetical protein
MQMKRKPAAHYMLADKLLQGNEVVIACRKGLAGERLQGESFLALLEGKTFNILVQILLLPGIKDSQCGLKGFPVNPQR